MNQISRQKATSPVERDFYKFLNNVNFGIDFRKTLATVILNLFMMNVVKFPTSNNLIVYLTTKYIAIFVI